MIKYIKKLIKKQRLLKKYEIDINNDAFILQVYKSGYFYDFTEKDMHNKLRCYNRLKKL